MATMNNTITVMKGSPRWLADFADPEIRVAHFPAKIDAAQFRDSAAITITLTAGITAADVAASITAITFPSGVVKIPKGQTIWFGGTTAPVTLSADYTGGTSLAILAAPENVANASTATYKPFGTRVNIPSGTFVGRTWAEQATGTNFGPASAGDNEVYLILNDVVDAYQNNNVEFARNGATVKQNYLPEWTVAGAANTPISTTAAVLALLRAAYVTITGTN